MEREEESLEFSESQVLNPTKELGVEEELFEREKWGNEDVNEEEMESRSIMFFDSESESEIELSDTDIGVKVKEGTFSKRKRKGGVQDPEREEWREKRSLSKGKGKRRGEKRESHKPRGLVYWILRWPVLVFVGFIVGLEFTLYVLVRWFVVVYEAMLIHDPLSSEDSSNPLFQMIVFPLRYLRNPPPTPQTYRQWKERAIRADETLGNSAWKKIDENPFYDSSLVSSITNSLNDHLTFLSTLIGENGSNGSKSGKGLERSDHIHRFLHDLVASCKHNIGGIENQQLYSYSYYGTKYVVEEFIETVVDSIEHVVESEEIENKPTLFRKLSKTYGKTALCLSGGASFGYYHLGVVKCLLENGVLPKIISGTSAGALISSFICVRTDDELKGLLTPDLYERFQANDEPIFTVLKRFFNQGVMFDISVWEQKLRKHITKGDTTFLEAYESTGRIFNISVAAEEKYSPPYFLNYKTTPNVVIWSAVLASAAVPGILPSIELRIKNPKTGQIETFKTIGGKWRDGVLRADIPFTGLKQLFNVSYTIVSQVNPHVVPFFYENRGSGGSPTLHRKGKGWRGGFVASMLEDFLKLDLRKWIQLLHNLNLLPRIFGQDWSMVFLQNFAGNVTIVPEFKFRDYLYTISDPDYNGMRHYIRNGEKKTWPKLCMITNRMKIEQALEKALEKYPLK